MAETQTLEALVYSAQGTKGASRALPEATFDGVVNVPVMHQAVKAFLANRRQGTASTKTRGKVVGGNQKPWKQKGTGRARQGSIRAPNWPGGGTVFGPIPRSYTQIVPKQVKQLARRSAFNCRAREGAVLLVDTLDWSAPKTKSMVSLIAALGAADKKVLLLTDGVKHNVYMSARNLERTHVMPYSDASTYHILWSDVVVIEASALSDTPAAVAEAEAAPVRTSRAKKAAAAASEE